MTDLSNQMIESSEEDDLAGSTFGCCHRYRECSDAKHCLCTQDEKSSRCAYRKNLEAGNIFYGRNANGFNIEQFNCYLDRLEQLSPDAQEAFKNLIIAYCWTKRNRHQVLIRNHFIEAIKCLNLFDFSPADSYIIEKCGYNNFKNLIKKTDKAAYDSFQKYLAKYKQGKTKVNSKEALKQWLNSDGAAIRQKLIAPYCLASGINYENISLYIEEIFREKYFDEVEKGMMPVSPLIEDGIIQ